MRSQKGLTLAEVLALTSVAVLAVTATATRTLPIFSLDAARLAAESVHTYLQLARVEAVSRERVCTLTVDAGRRSMRVTDSAGTLEPGDDVVLHEIELPRGVHFVDPEIVPAAEVVGVLEASFDGRGRASGSARSVGVSDGKATRKVSVFPNGELLLERWDGSRWARGS